MRSTQRASVRVCVWDLQIRRRYAQSGLLANFAVKVGSGIPRVKALLN